MKLKPFDLTRAKAGDPVVTRDGRKARIVCYDRKGKQPLVAMIDYGHIEEPANFGLDGRYSFHQSDSIFDLFMAPKKRKIAVNIFRNENTGQLVCSHVLFPETARTSGFAPAEGYLCTLTGEIEE